MAEVKIEGKSYKIGRLDNGDIKKLERYRTGKEIDLLDFDTYVLLYTLGKADPDIQKMTIEEFDKLLDIGEVDRIRKEINDASGFNKYVKKIGEKNLNPGIGKK